MKQLPRPKYRCCICKDHLSNKEMRALHRNDSDDSDAMEAQQRKDGPAMCTQCYFNNAHLNCLSYQDWLRWKKEWEWTCSRCKLAAEQKSAAEQNLAAEQKLAAQREGADLLMCDFFQAGPKMNKM